VNGCCVDTLITVKTSPPWRLRLGSASALPTSGWLDIAQAVPLLWWIVGVFAAPSGERWIHGNCNAPLTFAM